MRVGRVRVGWVRGVDGDRGWAGGTESTHARGLLGGVTLPRTSAVERTTLQARTSQHTQPKEYKKQGEDAWSALPFHMDRAGPTLDEEVRTPRRPTSSPQARMRPSPPEPPDPSPSSLPNIILAVVVDTGRLCGVAEDCRSGNGNSGQQGATQVSGSGHAPRTTESPLQKTTPSEQGEGSTIQSVIRPFAGETRRNSPARRDAPEEHL